jgi:hypothetical protein
MKNLLITLLFFISLSLKAQEGSEMELKKISIKDSIAVNKVFQKLLKAIESKQEKVFLELTLNKVECNNCVESSDMVNYVSNIDLYNNQFKTFETSAVYKALKKRGYHISTNEIKDYKPKNLPKSYAKDLILFEVWIHTYLPNEWAEGHEGQSNIFQFVKIGNEYKLYGLSSIP